MARGCGRDIINPDVTRRQGTESVGATVGETERGRESGNWMTLFLLSLSLHLCPTSPPLCGRQEGGEEKNSFPARLLLAKCGSLRRKNKVFFFPNSFFFFTSFFTHRLVPLDDGRDAATSFPSHCTDRAGGGKLSWGKEEERTSFSLFPFWTPACPRSSVLEQGGFRGSGTTGKTRA